MTMSLPHGDEVALAFLDQLYRDVDSGWLNLFCLDRTTGTRHVDWRRVEDIPELAAIADDRSAACCVWFSVATRHDNLGPAKRGGVGDCAVIPALWVDIDVAGDNHKVTDKLPATMAEAHRLLDAFPIPPTAVVASGGGLQAWWSLAEPIPVDEASLALLRRWGATWAKTAADHDLRVDNVFNADRVMRLPGTLNRKNDPVPVTVLHADWERRWGLDDLDGWLIEPPQPQQEVKGGRSLPYIGPERPGDAYNVRHSGGDVLRDLGFRLVKTDRDGNESWEGPWKDKGETSATVYADDGHATIWSDSALATWPALKLRRPHDPYGLLVFTKYAGDFAAASRDLAARGYGAPPVELDQLMPDTDTEPADAPAPTGAILPAGFWEERPVLTQIRQAAHSRIRAPDLVLHAVLARVAAYSLHTIEIPPIVGSPGSLNYFTSAIGPSGSGKSSGVSIAAELVPRPGLDVADNQPLGSGEGLAELYMGTVEEEDDKGKKIRVRRQVRHNAFVYGDEGAALTAMMQRQGATLPEALRRAWSGADLGQANANADRTRVIHGGQYRMGLVVGFQPELAGRLLDDHEAGTPQRFTWAYAVDPGVPDQLPPWPGELELPRIAPLDLAEHKITVRGYVRHRMGVAQAIIDELQTQAKARVRGTSALAALDAHEPLHRLKIAALLAILDGRLDIDLDDWRLADVIWTTSCAVRASVVASVKASLDRSEGAKTEVYARRELVVQASRLSAGPQVERVAKLIARRVHEAPERPDDGWARRDLMHWVASRDRGLLEPAISAAIEHEWVVDNYGRYQPGESAPA